MTATEARAVKRLLGLLAELGPWGIRTKDRADAEEALRALYNAWRRRKRKP